MDFNNTTEENGIVQDIDFMVNSTRATYSLKRIASDANRAMDEVVSIILGADGRWQFDDTNYTDLPIGTTNLVANQQDYSFDPEQIDITRVECKDQNGMWQYLSPFDQRDLTPPGTANIPNTGLTATGTFGGNNYSLTSFMEQAGTPIFYDKIANSIFLYPKPSYNSSGGLKVYFQRKPYYFQSTDTTTQPGFAKHLHKIIPLKCAYMYAVSKILASSKIQQLQIQIQAWEQKIKDFYASRKKDEKVVMVARNTPSL